jgi:lipid-A-disaccharide synthase
MLDKTNFLIIVGEPSGDTHGAHLMASLHKLNPEIQFWGTGGDAMIRNGLEAKYHARTMAVTGFVEVIKSLHFFRKIFKNIINTCKIEKPNAAILIDYPGFNIRLGLQLKKLGIPVYYYISPQVWAWKKGRVKTLKKFVKKMFIIFPFEETFYQENQIPVAYYGHPLLDQDMKIGTKEDFLSKHQLDASKPVIGFLPGSRINEISRHNAILCESIDILLILKPDVQIIVAGMRQLPHHLYGELDNHKNVKIIWDNPYEVMAFSDMVVVASGTASLEVAYLETPMIVIYKVSPISYWLAKIIISVEHLAMPNLIHGDRIIPELIQDEANPDLIVRWIVDLLEDEILRDEMIQGLKQIKSKLGNPGATDRIASDILK